MFKGDSQDKEEPMDLFFASPEAQICRSLREACQGRGARIVRTPGGVDPVQDFARSAARGLLSLPRRIESRFLYDATGSALFDEITKQPEYYLTRTETAILHACADRIRDLTGPAAIMELGSGNSLKTEHLLRAWLDHAEKVCYHPVDVSLSALVGACKSIGTRHPRARVIPVHCEYMEALPLLQQLSPVLVVFLGSSIGNFSPVEMNGFMLKVAAAMRPGDHFLLGLDLVKERSLLEAAYNDAAGVTARFTRNLFARMNRELGTDIDLEAIEHEARYQESKEQVEICARFTRQQTFALQPAGKLITIPEGEAVQTEISRKFRLEQVVPELERCGFATQEVFTDERRWFALLLLRHRAQYAAPRKGRGR